jgi:hypothetical protein
LPVAARSLWDKIIEPAPDRSEPKPKQAPRQPNTPDWLEAWKRNRPFIDAIASLLWLYAFSKAFLGDFDRELVEDLFPEAQWLVDLRFFIFLGLLAIAAALVRPRRLALTALYITAFPLVVVFWKTPKTLLKAKSWLAFFATVNVASTALTSLRYVVIATTAAAFAILLIAVADSPPLLGLAAVLIGGLLVASFCRTIIFSLTPSRFLRVQERGIQRVLKGKGYKSLVEVNKELRSDQVQRFDPDQQTQFVNNVGASVLSHRLLYFWAYQLDRYRQSPVPFLFGALAFVGLLLETLVGLSLINFAIYKADSTNFEFVSEPSIWVFGRYSFASLYGNEISAVQPHSDLANIVALLGLIGGIVIGAGLLAAIVLNRRTQTQDTATKKTIEQIKSQGETLARTHQEEYEISVDEAARRLRDLEYALYGVIEFLSTQIPPEFGPWNEEREASSSQAGSATTS